MNNFSDLQHFRDSINEARNSSSELTQKIMDEYIKATSNILPISIKNTLYMLRKYNIYDVSTVDRLLKSNKTTIKAMSKELGVPEVELETLSDYLQSIKKDIRLLPMYQSPSERDGLMAGNLRPTDLTIDFSTVAGRNQAAKMYMPMINKIVNQYVGKSRLDRQELMSAALMGLASAFKDWRPGDGSTTFKTYAAYRVKQQILNDINELGHTLSGTNWYASEKYGAAVLDAISLDALTGDDEFAQDHLSALGGMDGFNPETRDEEARWNKLYELIETNFKQRDINIFYRYFGLHGFKREKSKDIAKSMGMSEGNIRNSVINKMIAFLRSDRRAKNILSDIQDVYNESLMCELFEQPIENINNTLVSDDMFILLEELNKWESKALFISNLADALRRLVDGDDDIILRMLEGNFESIDKHFRKNKNIIISFLSNMYPTDKISAESDVALIERMLNIQEYYKKHKIKL